MSLEDKAKEYANSLKIDKDYPLSLSDVYYDGEGNLLTIANMFPVIYKQALKDLMEKAKALEQYPDGGLNGQAVYIQDLEKIAEDLKI